MRTNALAQMVIDNDQTADAVTIDTTGTMTIPDVYLRGTTYKTQIIPSPTQQADYTFGLPANPPLVNQTILFDGTQNIFKDLYSVVNKANQIVVTKDPNPGQFASVLDAINSIPTSGPDMPTNTNRYVIKVLQGDYAETATCNIPEYVFVVGESMEACRFTAATAGYDLFILARRSGLAFMTIFAVASPNHAIYFHDVGDYALIHKIEIESCATAVLCDSATQDCLVYIEYLGLTAATTYGVRCTDNNIYRCDVSLENYFINEHSDNGTIADGSLTNIAIQATVCVGDGTGNSVEVINGGSVNVRGGYYEGWETAISIPSDAAFPNVILSGMVFQNCTMNIDVQNGNASGHYDGTTDYNKLYINPSSTFYVSNKNLNIITVAKRGADFNTIAGAMNAITTASSTNLYIIYVGPGTYIESPFTHKSYVTIRGIFQTSTILVSSSPNTTFITASYYGVLSNLTLTTGVTDPTPPVAGGILIEYTGDTQARNYRCDNIVLDSCETLINLDSTNGPCLFVLTNSIINQNANFKSGIVINDDPVNHYVVQIFSDSITWSPNSQKAFTELIHATSTSPVINIFMIISDWFAGKVSPNITGNCITIEGACRANIDGSTLIGMGEAINVPAATYAPDIYVTSTNMNCTHNVLIQNTGANGVIQGLTDLSKVSIDPSATVAVNISGNGGDLALTGNLYQGSTYGQLTNLSSQIQNGASLGTVTEVSITQTGGLNITIAAGTGYVKLGTQPNDYLWYVSWASTPLILTASSYLWIFVNGSGTVATSTSEPDYIQNIILSSVKTNASGIDFILHHDRKMYHLASVLDNSIRNSLGNIVQSGLLITSPSALLLDISSGNFWYGTENFSVTSYNSISMIGYYRDGSGGWNTSAASTSVPLQYDDGSGTLAPIPGSDFVKHILYLVPSGEATTDIPTFVLQYGQTTYALSSDAFNGPVPISPSFLQQTCPIAGIVVQAGAISIPSSQIQDLRPTLAFKAGNIATTSDHNSLLNLTVGNAHPQYFRVDGTQVMAGNIDMNNTNSIVNVNLINGIVVQAHASRHNPGGSDALAIGIPVSISTANSQGSAASYALSDHIHAHGAQTDPTLHAIVSQTTNGFMSAADKITLDDRTDASLQNTLMSRDGNGDTHVVRIRLDNAAKDQSVNVRAPVALAASWSMTLPNDSGTSGYALTTDGAGNTSWSSASGLIDPMTTAGDMIYRNAGNVTTRLPVGTSNQNLKTINGVPTWSDRLVPLNETFLFDDFIGSTVGDTNWTTAIASGGSIQSAAPSIGKPQGVILVNIPTTASIGCAIYKQTNGFTFGNGIFTCEFSLLLPVLPSSQNKGTLQAGFGGQTSLSNNYGIYFEVSNNNLNWLAVTANAGTRTSVDTGVALAINTWYVCKFIVNAAATSVTFYINNVSVATIITNIPTGYTNISNPNFHFFRPTGSNSIVGQFYLDYYYHNYIFTTSRY
jgi:hypothetical protein